MFISLHIIASTFLKSEGKMKRDWGRKGKRRAMKMMTQKKFRESEYGWQKMSLSLRGSLEFGSRGRKRCEILVVHTMVGLTMAVQQRGFHGWQEKVERERERKRVVGLGLAACFKLCSRAFGLILFFLLQPRFDIWISLSEFGFSVFSRLKTSQ